MKVQDAIALGLVIAAEWEKLRDLEKGETDVIPRIRFRIGKKRYHLGPIPIERTA